MSVDPADVDPARRWVALEAGFNFRDLGGYPALDGREVRWGTLFRSDTLHRLTPADLEVFRALRLRTVVDLRAETEIADHGRLTPDACDGLDWHHVPMLDVVLLRPDDGPPAPPPERAEPLPPGQSYVQLLGSGEPIARVLSLVTGERSLPVVFHCTAGRDRTGMVAAMVLDLLGVPDDVIAEDYALTNAARARSDPWIQRHEPTFAAYLAQFPPEQRVTRPEVILGFLAAVRAGHGSVEGFLRDRGVDGASIDRFRDATLV